MRHDEWFDKLNKVMDFATELGLDFESETYDESYTIEFPRTYKPDLDDCDDAEQHTIDFPSHKRCEDCDCCIDCNCCDCKED